MFYGKERYIRTMIRDIRSDDVKSNAAICGCRGCHLFIAFFITPNNAAGNGSKVP
jgi:hypothetical protein